MKIKLLTKHALLCMLIGCLSMELMASDNKGEASISLETSKSNARVMVRILNISASMPATIEIRNKFGRAIYQESIQKQESHIKEYDFSNLRAGQYTLVLKSEGGEVAKPFFVDTHGIASEDHREAFSRMAPSITKKAGEDQVKIRFNNHSGFPLSVRLTDQYGKILYTEQVSGSQQYAKALSLKQLPTGRYQVSIVGDTYGYHEEIRKF